MLMFSYGMNTNVTQMQQRCPDAILMGVGTLSNYRLTFSSFADVVVDKHSAVAGVVWDITDDCLEALDWLEGYPHSYNREIKEIEMDGKTMEALCYYMVGDRPFIPPSREYLKLVIAGYRQNGIAMGQISDALTV